MSRRRGNGFSFAKLIAAFAVLFGIGFGLCGLSTFLPSSDQEFHTNWLSGLSLVMMVLSFLGVIVTLVALAIAHTIGFSSRNSSPQTLFRDTNENSGNGEDAE